MPKTDIVYGKNYRPCPCAQIQEYENKVNTYFTAVCYSPKRNGAHQKIQETGQVRICMGGSTGKKRYTSCPYYVKGAQISVPKRKRRVSLQKSAGSVFIAVVCLAIAGSCLSSGNSNALLAAAVFGLVGIGCLVSLFTKSDKIS